MSFAFFVVGPHPPIRNELRITYLKADAAKKYNYFMVPGNRFVSVQYFRSIFSLNRPSSVPIAGIAQLNF